MKKTSVALALLLAAGFARAEAALTARAAELMAQAQSDAEVVASLPENTRLEVLARKGAWSQVRTAGGQGGWLRMAILKPVTTAAPAAAAASVSALGALNSLLSSGRTSNSATVTTGVRGLGEQELQNAQANPSELERMQQYAAGKATAQAFAQRNRLVPVMLDELPAPAPAHDNRRDALGG